MCQAQQQDMKQGFTSDLEDKKASMLCLPKCEQGPTKAKADVLRAKVMAPIVECSMHLLVDLLEAQRMIIYTSWEAVLSKLARALAQKCLEKLHQRVLHHIIVPAHFSHQTSAILEEYHGTSRHQTSSSMSDLGH